MAKTRIPDLAIAAVSGAGVWTVGLIFSLTSHWEWVISNVGAKTFGDLRIITSTAGCLRNPEAFDFFGVSCSIWATSPGSFPSMPYNYPRLWASLLARVGIEEAATEALGMFFISLFSVGLALLIFVSIRGQKHRVALSALILFGALSPGALLGLERGNFDLLVFFVLALAIFFSSSSRYWLATFSFTVAAILKIFPLGALISLYARPDKKLRFLIAGILVSVGGFLMYLRDFPEIGGRTPVDDTASFGVAVLPLLALKTLESTDGIVVYSRIFGWLFFSIIVMIYVVALNFKKNNSFKEAFKRFTTSIATDEISRTVFLVGAGSFGTAYLLGTNYEYRVIFLLPVLAALGRSAEKFNELSIFLMTSLVAGLLLTNRFDGYQYMGDILFAVILPFLAIATIDVTKKSRTS